ncbi:MAG: OTU domain-containing protein [Hyalangium sp.]|uniref:OTU domain-containing protein n=1 Tax=Hyalangium sp. TaxID=2028555 RepID=UPI00389A9581
MPTINKAVNIQQVLVRLLEIHSETKELLNDFLDAKKKDANVDKLVQKANAWVTELGDAMDKINNLGKGNSEAAICEDVLGGSVATLLHIRDTYKPKGLLQNNNVLNVSPIDLSPRMQDLIAAYKEDTAEDRVWGGDLEAHTVADVLQFRCKVFTVSDQRFTYVTTVGRPGDEMAYWSLLHRGNHYDVVKRDIQGDEAFNLTWVEDIAPDGNCLYASMQRIYIRCFRTASPDLAHLRQAVRARISDEDVRIAITAIAISREWSGVGPRLGALLDEIAGKTMNHTNQAPRRAELLWALSVMILAFAKKQGGKAEEVQAMNLDGQIVVASNSAVEVGAIADALMPKRREEVKIEKQFDELWNEQNVESLQKGVFKGFTERLKVVLDAYSRECPMVHSKKDPKKAHEWFQPGDREALYILEIPDGNAYIKVHAEQKLLVALATRLKNGQRPRRNVVFWGTKPPCDACRKVFEKFQEVFAKELGPARLIYSPYAGRKTEGIDIGEELEKGDKKVYALDVEKLAKD